MAKTQAIRHMPSRGFLTKSRLGIKSITAPKTSLKLFDPARSGLKKLHKGRVATSPINKTIPDAKAKEVDDNSQEQNFPTEEWHALLKIQDELTKRQGALKDDRFEHPVVDIKVQAATESRISALRPAHLTKALKGTFNARNYRGVHVGKALVNKLDEMLGKSVEGKKKKALFSKQDLSQKISYKKHGEGIPDINIFDWLQNLFTESAPGKSFKDSIHQLESAVYDSSQSTSKEDALKIRSKYGQGNFFELRAGLAFEYLKAKGEIIDYKQTVHNSYLDHLGIDFLIRAKVDNKVKILAVQIKSSESGAREFYQPKQLTLYNFRKRQALNTMNQRQGIILINMHKKSLSQIADEIAAYITTKTKRTEKSISLIPDFDFSQNFDIDKLRSWYQVLENAFVEQIRQEDKIA